MVTLARLLTRNLMKKKKKMYKRDTFLHLDEERNDSDILSVLHVINFIRSIVINYHIFVEKFMM